MNASPESTAGPVAASDADSGNRHGAEEFEDLRTAVAEQRGRNLRLLADLDNLRRRAAKELESAQYGGRRAALLPLLPVLDALERALATGSIDAHFYEGVAATFRLFTDALRDAGAEPFDSLGLKFDPEIHDAVETVTRDDVKPGTITRQALRGWRLDGDLLRPARVVVAAFPDDGCETPSDV